MSAKLSEVLVATSESERMYHESMRYSRVVNAVRHAEKLEIDPLPILRDVVLAVCRENSNLVDEAVRAFMLKA